MPFLARRAWRYVCLLAGTLMVCSLVALWTAPRFLVPLLSARFPGCLYDVTTTARAVARKYNASVTAISAETLFQPALNIELGTAYIRDQYDKFA